MKPLVEMEGTAKLTPAVRAERAFSGLNENAETVHVGKRLRMFALFAAGLSLLFILPLVGLVRYSFTSDLNSHVILIPCISAYLIWLRRGKALPVISSSPALAVIPLALGLAGLEGLWGPARVSEGFSPEDHFALTTFCYLCFLWAGALAILGGTFLRRFLFEASFLIFAVPMPAWLRHGMEVFFQYASADAAALLFGMTGSTVFREGLVFHLPGIVIQVAEECSGIRSSYVLFITSLLAGEMFLRSPWKRAVLAIFVIPLGILRNGFRIFTIGMLCVHVDPSMIDSPIHHRGGPVFFVISLIPLFALLLWMRRRERAP
jgi:exosortase C (VPDSG-CTERM-specific)